MNALSIFKEMTPDELKLKHIYINEEEENHENVKTGFKFVHEGIGFTPDALSGMVLVSYPRCNLCPENFMYAYDENIKSWFGENKLCPLCIEKHGDIYGQIEEIK